ncbi:MAG: hypothetical protein WC073_11285 [Sterolibacterium sp.]
MVTTYSSADAIADIPGADYPTLSARFKDTAKVMDVLSAERKALADQMRAREEDAAARLRLGTLTDAEKEVYRQILESRQ